MTLTKLLHLRVVTHFFVTSITEDLRSAPFNLPLGPWGHATFFTFALVRTLRTFILWRGEIVNFAVSLLFYLNTEDFIILFLVLVKLSPNAFGFFVEVLIRVSELVLYLIGGDPLVMSQRSGGLGLV